MRGDARAVFLITCGLGALHMLGFWIHMGNWPFGGEGSGTAFLKSTFGDDFDVLRLGECFMQATLSMLFYPLAILAHSLGWSPVEAEDDETTDADEETGEPEEFEIE